MNDRDLEIITALKTIYGDEFQHLDEDVAKSTIFEIVDSMNDSSNETPLPYDKLSETGQLELMRQLIQSIIPSPETIPEESV